MGCPALCMSLGGCHIPKHVPWDGGSAGDAGRWGLELWAVQGWGWSWAMSHPAVSSTLPLGTAGAFCSVLVPVELCSCSCHRQCKINS